MATGAQATVFEAVSAALPSLPTPQVVDILEFIYAQHSGSSFNPDNTSKAPAIIEFLEQRPFAATPAGVTSLACLARHALSKSEGKGNSPEHQLWLLAIAFRGQGNFKAPLGTAHGFFDPPRTR